jgi:amino-acid N-acetyltransferase
MDREGPPNVTEYRDRVDTIREVFSYLKQFRGTTFVVRIDNAVLDDPLFSIVVKDLSLLHEAGISIALVPSAKERIDEILRTYEVPYSVVRGVRITSEEAIPFIKMAAFDVSNRVMTMLSANGMTAVIGNWVRARGIGVIDGVDYQSAGLVESVRVDSVRKVMDDGVVPIFPCIGWSSVGTPYNISSNELAVVVATSVGAEKLIFLTAREGFSAEAFAVPETIPVAPGGRLANFSLADLDAFFAANPGREADLELLQRARRACAGGVERVHILDGRSEGVILKETFSNLGSGTMVYSNRYGGIRAADHAALRGQGNPPAPQRAAAGGETSGLHRFRSRRFRSCLRRPARVPRKGRRDRGDLR